MSLKFNESQRKCAVDYGLEKYSVVFNHSIAYTQVDWILALKYYLCCDKLDYSFQKKYLNLSDFYSLYFNDDDL